MTIDNFIQHYLSIGGVDYDGAYGKQCVDLFRAYHRDVVGSKKQPRGVRGAKDFWTNYNSDPELKNNYERIANTTDFIPRKGDVMLWKTGEFGHVAVLADDKSTLAHFTSEDQNWYGKRQIKLVKHNYNGVYGVLRPRKVNMSDDTMSIDKKTFEELVKKSTEYDKFIKAGYKNVSDVKKLEKKVDDLSNAVSQRDKQIKVLEDEKEDLATKLAECQSQECEQTDPPEKLKVGDTTLEINGATWENGHITVNYDVEEVY